MDENQHQHKRNSLGPLVATVLFGAFLGVITAGVVMIAEPSTLRPTPEESARGSKLATSFLAVGLVGGALLGFAAVEVYRHHESRMPKN
jgi:hypothetical protein